MKNSIEELNLLTVADVHGLEMITPDEIKYLKGERNQVAIYTTAREGPFISSMCLGHYQEILPKKFFIRIHKSYIINLKFLKKYIKGKFSHVLLKDKTALKVSIQYRTGLLVILGRLK